MSTSNKREKKTSKKAPGAPKQTSAYQQEKTAAPERPVPPKNKKGGK